jgi:hypothetical protein
MASHTVTAERETMPTQPQQDISDKHDVLQLDNIDAKGSTADWQQLLADAKASEEEEKNMPLLVAFRVYPKAVAWTFAVTLCFVM